MKVSVLLLTYNEAQNLPACLEAIRWCDDIVVVDSGSTDESVAIATAYGARVLTRRFDGFAAQRNYGLDHGEFQNDWVLHLDADEIVTRELQACIAGLEADPAIDGYRIPSRTIFFGRWLRHAGMWPTYQVRVGHARRLRFVQVGHGQREDARPERLGVLAAGLDHYSFSHGLKAWLEKHVRYAKDEARLLLEERRTPIPATIWGADGTTRRRAAKTLSSRLPLFLRPAARFAYVYLLRQGFRDGASGFVYAFMLSVYEAMIAILAYEAAVTGPRCDDAHPRRAARETPAAMNVGNRVET